jgi:hypothetical protein
MKLSLQHIIKLLYPLLILGGILSTYGQTFTYSGNIYGSNSSGISGVPVYLYKRTTTTSGNTNTTVKTYKTHASNGSTSQYANYPMTRVEMDKLFNTAYSNTVLWWTGTVGAAYSLNFNDAGTLGAGGASVPNGGDYYSTQVTFVFTPKETGTYSFGLTSDDGGDLWLNGYGNLIEWYGGKGTGQYMYGNVSLTAGTAYTFIARMQEYGGGDGLLVNWKRPSQAGYSLQTDEVGGTTTTTSAWALQATSTTSALGAYAFSTPTAAGVEFYITFNPPALTVPVLSDGTLTNSIVVGNTTLKSVDYFRYDVNGDNRLTVSDTYSILARKSGILSSFTPIPTSRIFNSTEWSTINLSTANLKVSYPGLQTVTISSPVSGGVSNYYITRLGNTN